MSADVYAAEAKERWGETEAYKESQRRTKNYTEADWQESQNEAEHAVALFVAAMESGLVPSSDEAMAAAEAHRQHINRWFYPCSYDMHTGLASMYLADSRFTEHYEKYAVGLAQFVHDAIYANAVHNS